MLKVLLIESDHAQPLHLGYSIQIEVSVKNHDHVDQQSRISSQKSELFKKEKGFLCRRKRARSECSLNARAED